MTVKTSSTQVMNPYGTWSNIVQYEAEVVYGGVSNAPLYVSCPTVKSTNGLLYYATGYNKTTGLPGNPPLGTAPQSAPDYWEPLTAGDGTGSVTIVSVLSENGLGGSVANATSTPAITLSTSITGVLKGNGTAISAAVAGDFPTLNQNTTGNAATATTSTNVAGGALGDILYQTATGITGFIPNGVGALTNNGSGVFSYQPSISPTTVNWTPTISVAVPGDLNITYNQQFGTLTIIGNMAFLNFYVAGSLTQTTAHGTINIVGQPLTFIPSDEAVGVMDIILQSTTLYTAGYTYYTSYVDGTGPVQIIANSTNPALNSGAGLTISVTDIDNGTTFKFRGQIVVPLA